MLLLAAASLFMVHGAPLEMPRADAYLGKSGETYRLIDRYDTGDLWTARTVLGRWYDDDLRVFTLSEFRIKAPPFDSEVKTREKYYEGTVKPDKRDEESLVEAIKAVSPIEIAEKYARPHEKIRGYKEVRYYEGTNETAIVAAYLPEKSEFWRVATWELIEGDDIKEKREELEEKWLREEAKEIKAEKWETEGLGERELLKKDVEHSVRLYDNWHFTSSEDFAVVDDLKTGRGLVERFTNEIAQARAEYRKVMPGAVDGSNVLGTARIFADREEYLEAAGEDKAWTAAYWSVARRELVAYLPEAGEAELMKTLRHEAFHQYLAYAASMITTSPWLNEGYAQYFEDMGKERIFEGASKQDLEEWASYLPMILAMDYEQFYSGDVEFNYRMAKSIAYFLEVGAPKVRFEPFKNVKRDYMKELVAAQDMRSATVAAFKNQDTLKLFVREWLKFYADM